VNATRVEACNKATREYTAIMLRPMPAPRELQANA
jgi:hypothetical protein